MKIRILTTLAAAIGTVATSAPVQAAESPYLGEIIMVGYPFCPYGWAEANGLEFIFGPDARNYDWLVVYDDLPRFIGMTEEPLACPPENTLLITSEPSGVKVYGRSFVRQFGHVLTSQEPIALRLHVLS